MIGRIIQLLKEEQARAANDSLSRPPGEGKDIVFEYGKSVGYYAGLNAALKKVELVLKDQDEHDNNL
jgi:hypothetical protein